MLTLPWKGLSLAIIYYFFFFFLPIVHGHPNETEKVGQLIIPAALTQQHSGHFPITQTGTAQRKIYKLG